jgi:hypothetical protein
MAKTIKSTKFYKSHSASYFASAKIIDGKIVSLYTEYGREGGEVWAPDHEHNGTLRECMSRICEDFGEKTYGAIAKAAYRENLLSLGAVKKNILRREISAAKRRVSETATAHKEAVARLNRLKYGLEE